MRPQTLVLRDERGDTLLAALAARGVSALRYSPLRYEYMPWRPPECADWAAITSAETVRAVCDRWPQLGKVAAVGPATARALAAEGIPVTLVPAVASGAGLAEAMPPGEDASVWLPRSNLAGDELPRLLTAKGYRVIDQVVYRTVPVRLPPALESDLVGGIFNLVIVYSPSAVAALPDTCRVPALAIGEPTAAALRHAGFAVAAIAAHPTDGAVADAAATIIGERKD